MKNFIVLVASVVASFIAVEGFAGDCRITPGPGFQPPCVPEAPRIDWPQTVCPPVVPCYIAQPVSDYCPPVQRCRIRAWEPVVPPCTIRVPQPRMCTKCPGQVCHCHLRKIPTCRIQPCQPAPRCRIVICKPVISCRIRPCESIHPHPGYGDPGYVDPQFGHEAHPQVAPPVDLPEVQTGQEVTIDGGQFGFQPGTVAVRIGGMILQAEVTGWTETEVRAILPTLPIAGSAQAQVAVLDATGQVADQLDVVMVPQSQQLARR